MKNVYKWMLIFALIFSSCSKDEDTVKPGFTYVPDDGFESVLIYKGWDDKMDDYVLTKNISEIENFIFQFEKDVFNIIGIEDFSNLKNLTLYGGSIKEVDLSQNEKLFHIQLQSELEQIILPQNDILVGLHLWGNNFQKIDLKNLPNLQSLDVRKNKLNSLDLSANPLLNQLDASENLFQCIQVSEDQMENITEEWTKDETVIYSTNCR